METAIIVLRIINAILASLCTVGMAFYIADFIRETRKHDPE